MSKTQRFVASLYLQGKNALLPIDIKPVLSAWVGAIDLGIRLEDHRKRSNAWLLNNKSRRGSFADNFNMPADVAVELDGNRPVKIVLTDTTREPDSYLFIAVGTNEPPVLGEFLWTYAKPNHPCKLFIVRLSG